MKKVIHKYLFFTFMLASSFSSQATMKLRSCFGNFLIEEQILCDLIQCPSVQRLKQIHQYGISFYTDIINYPYSRFDHSIGVLHLVRKFGGSLPEQIAALLHDVSHTVFSHVGDHLFASGNNNSYQDDIHLWFLQHTEIPTLLNHHGYTLKNILHKNNDFLMLEQDLPALCADRIEYILHGGLLENILTKKDVEEILEHITFQNGSWIFDAQEVALKIGLVSLYLTEHIFCSKNNFVAYDLAAQALTYGIKHKIINLDDIHFGIDEIIWQKLCLSLDQKLIQIIDSLLHVQSYYHIASRKQKSTPHAHGKFRGVDPLVTTENGPQHLTQLNISFKQKFDNLKKAIKKGFYINPSNKNAAPLSTEIVGH